MNRVLNYIPRSQKLPPIFWLQRIKKDGTIERIDLYDPKTYVHWFENCEHKWAYEDNKHVPFTPLSAIAKLIELEEKGYGGFVSTPVPCNGEQQGVIAISAAGCTREYILAKNVNDKVNKAYASVFCLAETEPKKKVMPIQKIVADDKNDPMKMVITINYPYSKKPYFFRCRKWHMIGDRVCVHTNDEYENVTVVKCETMRESEVIALANSFGYDDISEVYCDYAIADEDLKKLNKQAEPEEEYVEDMTELKAMQECFAPRCDYVADPNPDGYTYDEPDNYPPEEDYDDLPE